MAKVTYSLYVDLGNWTAPAVGYGYVISQAFIEGAGIIKKRNDEEIYERVEINGDIVFKGVEYDALKTLEATNLKVGVKFYEGSNLIATGFINLSSGKYNEDEKTVSVGIAETVDDYTEILKNLDKETNIVSTQFTKYTLKFTALTTEATLFEKDTGAPPNIPSNYDNCPVAHPDAWASGVDYISATSTYYTRDWVRVGVNDYRCILNHTSNAGNQPPNALYWESATPFVYKQQQTPYNVSGYTYDDALSLYVKGACSQETINLEFDRFRKMFDILEALLNLADSTIYIDETGANGFCSYLTNNANLKYLFIADKSDIKRYYTSNQATFEYISLKRILEIYKGMFQLDWKIENGYFKFVHNTSTSKTVIGIDATAYLGKNWSKGKSEFLFISSSEIKKESWDFEKSNNPNFDGVPIEYDVPFKDEKTYNLEDINTNIIEVIKNTDKISSDGVVIAAANLTGSDYYIQETVGKIIVQNIMNGRLSMPQLIEDHHLVERPFNEGIVNNVLTSLTIKRNKEQTISLPVANPDDVDFSKLIRTDLADLEIFELSIKFDGSLAEIKGRY